MPLASDAPHLKRTLKSLKLCDEIIVVDGCDPDQDKKTRLFGVVVKKAIPGVTLGAYIVDSRNDWILVLRPNEELDERLVESLKAWKSGDHEESGFAFEISEKTGDDGWCKHLAEMRLVNRRKINWVDELPPNNTMAPKLPGDILRYPE